MALLLNRIKSEFLEACARVQTGSLQLKTPDGNRYSFGDGEPAADMDIRDWGAITACASRGDIGLGETYIDGLWETSSIEKVAQLALLNQAAFGGFSRPNRLNSLKYSLVDRVLRANSKSGARRNIFAHYDVGNAFYKLWLDPSMTYSSALFEGVETDLERAQLRKYDRILGRLGPGERVLEIGCGWGGFAERAADQGRDVTGITISPSQKRFADRRLGARAKINLQDYRNTSGRFDNIVSIEMIEAVGERYWPTYFRTIRDRLVDNGRALVQAIIVQDDYFAIYRRGSDFIRQYTFPGGMLLSKQMISEHAQRARMKVADVYAFGKDYARTLRCWSQAITEKSGKIAELGFGDRFLRNWQFYLGICAGSFEVAQTDVVQVELRPA